MAGRLGQYIGNTFGILKSTEQLSKVHSKQVLTYLKLKGLKLGFVLNFGCNLMKNGVER
jgi:GxxExxY protein